MLVFIIIGNTRAVSFYDSSMCCYMYRKRIIGLGTYFPLNNVLFRFKQYKFQI